MTPTEAAVAMREAREIERVAKTIFRAHFVDGEEQQVIDAAWHDWESDRKFAFKAARAVVGASPPDPRRSVEEIRKEIERLRPAAQMPRSPMDVAGTMLMIQMQHRIAALEWVLSKTEKANG